MPFYRRARRLLTGTFVVYAVLVAFHLGEFWPFSIYPMFSQGGNPWTRALVRDVEHVPPALWWETATLDDLPGEAFPLNEVGVNQNDIANFVSKSTTWNERRVAGLRRVFGATLDDHAIMIYRADGRLVDPDSVAITLTPFIALTPDSVAFNPHLTYPAD